MGDMGIGILGSPNTCFLRKFRWLLKIDKITGSSSSASANILPPSKSARPSITFREIEIQHLNETVYYPGKPDWKPLTVTLWGVKAQGNPVFDWIKELYDPQNDAQYTYANDDNFIMNQVTLEMLDACGNIMEEWVYEDCWLQNADHGELDMSDSGVANIDLTIRYARAYVI